MKFIYTCDIHGNNKKFEKVIELCKKHNIYDVVYGGDFCPKRSNNDIKREYIINYIDPFFRKLKENNINLIYIYGNDDPEALEDLFDSIISKYSNIHNINNRLLEYKDISFVGLSNTMDNPFYCKDRIVNEEGFISLNPLHDKVLVKKSSMEVDVNDWINIYKKELPYMKDLLNGLPKSNSGNKVIYVFHCPPSNCSLDVCENGFNAGSKDIYNFIYEAHPYMSLHGHIHESYEMSGVWKTNINDSICIQPGQYRTDVDKLVYVLIDTDIDSAIRFEE